MLLVLAPRQKFAWMPCWL